MGLIILAFFLNGKKTSCSYGPDARVLKNINTKKIVYGDNVKSYISSNKSDSTKINYVLKKGDINFSESKTRQEPCAIYIIEGDYKEEELTLTIENCDSIATITNIKVEKHND